MGTELEFQRVPTQPDIHRLQLDKDWGDTQFSCQRIQFIQRQGIFPAQTIQQGGQRGRRRVLLPGLLIKGWSEKKGFSLSIITERDVATDRQDHLSQLDLDSLASDLGIDGHISAAELSLDSNDILLYRKPGNGVHDKTSSEVAVSLLLFNGKREEARQGLMQGRKGQVQDDRWALYGLGRCCKQAEGAENEQEYVLMAVRRKRHVLNQKNCL